jgi:hypothetical protein
MESSQSGVAVRLLQSSATDSLNQVRLKVHVSWRLITGRSTDGGAFVVKHGHQEWPGTAPVPRFPQRAQFGQGGFAIRVNHRYFDGLRTHAQRHSDGAESARIAEFKAAQFVIVQECHLARLANRRSCRVRQRTKRKLFCPMFVAGIIDEANLRAKAPPIGRGRRLYEPFRRSLNSRSLRKHGMVAVNTCFGVRLQPTSVINYVRANRHKPEMPPEDFETRPNNSDRLRRKISHTEGKRHEYSPLLRGSGEDSD